MTPDVRSASATADDLPYRYGTEDVNFGISEFAVDDADPGEPEYEERVVPLYRYEPWDQARLTVSLTISGNKLDRLFENDGPYDAKLIVAVDAEATQTRYEVVIEEEPMTEGTYEGEVALDHDLLRGSVTLTPRLVRTADSSTGLPYAPREGMRMAGGESWEVQVDEPDESGDGFPFKYRDFSDGDYPEDAVHVMGPNPSEPAVLINNTHDPIVDVLQTGGFYSFDLYLKNVIKAELGTSTWMQLVIYTAGTIAESEEPEFDWQEGVIEEIAPYLYDDNPRYEVAVERLGEAVSDPGELQEFILDLNEAVQLYTEQAEQLNKFIQEFA